MTGHETKICPYCAEEIKAAAIICRYCQKGLSATFQPEMPTEQRIPCISCGTKVFQQTFDSNDGKCTKCKPPLKKYKPLSKGGSSAGEAKTKIGCLLLIFVPFLLLKMCVGESSDPTGFKALCNGDKQCEEIRNLCLANGGKDCWDKMPD